ncbi:hypothetical protein [Demetria terragena]|uniref:hypothetical protein n=1 Tax=Demetria terragena TaxID=63959 RepID=UPI000382D8D0|nr:hypothetical protein [Demetria terragena]
MLLNFFLLTLLVVLPTAATVALLRMDRDASGRNVSRRGAEFGTPFRTPEFQRMENPVGWSTMR